MQRQCQRPNCNVLSWGDCFTGHLKRESLCFKKKMYIQLEWLREMSFRKFQENKRNIKSIPTLV